MGWELFAPSPQEDVRRPVRIARRRSSTEARSCSTGTPPTACADRQRPGSHAGSLLDHAAGRARARRRLRRAALVALEGGQRSATVRRLEQAETPLRPRRRVRSSPTGSVRERRRPARPAARRDMRRLSERLTKGVYYLPPRPGRAARRRLARSCSAARSRSRRSSWPIQPERQERRRTASSSNLERRGVVRVAGDRSLVAGAGAAAAHGAAVN